MNASNSLIGLASAIGIIGISSYSFPTMTYSSEGNRKSISEWSPLFKDDPQSSYYNYKSCFEETTRLTPRELAYIQLHHLEDRLNAIKFDFWRFINSIVTSYFAIMNLLRVKRELEDDIEKLWSDKLYEFQNVNVETEDSNAFASTSSDDPNSEKSGADQATVGFTQLEDGMMRFKVALIFSADLVKTIQRSVFSLKNQQVLPGHSSLKNLEKEAKWFRKEKINLGKEIERLKEQRELLKMKLNLFRVEDSKCQNEKGSSFGKVFRLKFGF